MSHVCLKNRLFKQTLTTNLLHDLQTVKFFTSLAATGTADLKNSQAYTQSYGEEVHRLWKSQECVAGDDADSSCDELEAGDYEAGFSFTDAKLQDVAQLVLVLMC